MSKTNNMTDFQRTRSKVWFPNLDDDDDDIQHHHSWRRQPSSSPESRRVLSGSPSNGSHKSQDSGFSDSESSPLGMSRHAKDEDDGDDDNNDGKRQRPDGVLPEAHFPSCRTPSSTDGHATSTCPPEPCDCFLPACELSRKFRSYEYVPRTCDAADPMMAATPLRPTAVRYGLAAVEEPRTPNRTCFIVDELPKSGGGGTTPAQPQSTPGSVKSFDGHFNRSENVTVVENVGGKQQDGNDNDDDDDDDDKSMIIDPPTPFVDRLQNDAADTSVESLSESNGGLDAPEHTSTPKSTKDRCCTPRLHYRKDLQLKKPKNLQASYDR